MSIEADPGPLYDLDLAIRRVTDELERGALRRRLAAERARDRWRGGHRRAFDEATAQLDLLTSRTLAELATLRRSVRAIADGAA